MNHALDVDIKEKKNLLNVPDYRCTSGSDSFPHSPMPSEYPHDDYTFGQPVDLRC